MESPPRPLALATALCLQAQTGGHRLARRCNTEGNTTFLRIYGILGEPGGRGGWSRTSTNQVSAGCSDRGQGRAAGPPRHGTWQQHVESTVQLQGFKKLRCAAVCFYFRSCTDTIPLCGVRGVWSEEKHMDHGALRSGPALVRTARLWTDLAAATFSPGSASELGCSGQAGQTARRARTLPHRACTLPHRACGGMRSACPPQLRPLTM